MRPPGSPVVPAEHPLLRDFSTTLGARAGRRSALRVGVTAASGALAGAVALAGLADASPSAACAEIAPGFSCVMQDRIGAFERYLDDAPGSIGILLEDRTTGAVWGNANAAVDYPAASTMKLAMTDILLRANVGNIDLTSTDRDDMFNALYTSNDDDDATALWDKYEDGSFLDRIRAFGMASAFFTSRCRSGASCTARPGTLTT